MPEHTDPRIEFAEWLHTELVTQFALERAPWALERVSRVQARLNECRIDRPALEATILWITPPLAFTLAGRYVYISRSLLERMPTDDAVAFVLAHEAGHHDLGHLDLFAGWTKWLPETPSMGYAAAVGRLLKYRTYGPAHESAADRYAVELA
ncbi:MAG TPA: M48 family metalloprotease, partial [Gemmatimonadaceae bacterium]